MRCQGCGTTFGVFAWHCPACWKQRYDDLSTAVREADAEASALPIPEVVALPRDKWGRAVRLAHGEES